MPTTQRHRVVVDDRALALRVGERLRAARKRAGLTQQALAGERYTKAYISALENGLAKPSVAALGYLSERLGVDPSALLSDTAHRWTRLEADLQLASGRWQEAAASYAGLLESAPELAFRAELLLGLAEALARLDRSAEAAAAASEASSRLRAIGRPADAALADYWLAYAEYQQENVAESRALLESILAEVRRGLRVAPDFEMRLLMALSSTASREGRHEAAIGYLAEVKGLSEGLDDRRRATYLFDLALSYRETGDLEAAIRSGSASLTLFRAMDAEAEAAAMENQLALTFLATGSVSRAAELAAGARARFERLGDRRWLAHVADTESQVALAAGDADTALERATAATTLAKEAASRPAQIAGLRSTAKAHAARGASAEALAAYERAAELARAEGRPRRLREVLTEWSELLAATGQLELAYKVAQEGLHAAG